MERRWCLLVLAAVAAVLPGVVRGTVEVMKDVTLGFGEALEHCREQSQLTEEMMEEFYHFWREDFKFEARAVGCAIHCMSRYFNLLGEQQRMHHDNTHKFIQSFPNGEVLSHQMVGIIHTCEQQHDAETDDCWRILRVAECFKRESQAQGLAPSMEMLMAEFIMEADV